MTYDDVVSAVGLDARTVRNIARADKQPQARTLHKLAEGLGVSVDELFAPPTGLSPEAFDAATNPVIDQVRTSQPDLFVGWSTEDFAELASRFGVGGELTEAGAAVEADAMNARRAVLNRAKVVLETSYGKILCELVDLLYEKVRIDE